MIHEISDANFPKDKDNRVYHLGIRLGELANRILTVGDPARAEKIALLLDSEETSGHPIFKQKSSRGFLVITGRYKGVPISIVSIGMGSAMMDFFVRECRASVTGTMAIIRFGSCGSFSTKPGSVIVPKGAYFIRRNFDYFLKGQTDDHPYTFSGVFKPHEKLSDKLAKALEAEIKSNGNKTIGPVVADGLNAEGCSFYSSQGRTNTDIWDDNENLLKDIQKAYPDTRSIEMETSTLIHLAQCAVDPKKRIKAAACMQVFADRTGNEFIHPDTVEVLEPLVGKVCLDVLVKTEVEDEMPISGTVWEQKNNKTKQN